MGLQALCDHRCWPQNLLYLDFLLDNILINVSSYKIHAIKKWLHKAKKGVLSIKYIKQSLRNSLQRHTGTVCVYCLGCDTAEAVTLFCCDELIITNLPVSQAINSDKHTESGVTLRAQHICTREISSNWTIFLGICVLTDICKSVCKTTHNSAHADTRTHTTPGVKAICPPISLSVAHHP